MKNYYTIHAFMYEDLNLSGTDLYVFAFMYSFKEYKGSVSYLAKAVGVKSTTTIQSSLKRLIDLGLIKKEKSESCFSTCKYTILYNKPTKRHLKGEWKCSDKDRRTIIGGSFPEDEVETKVVIGGRL